MLLAKNTGLSRSELDGAIERYLDRTFGEPVDFALENSLPFLLKDGLVRVESSAGSAKLVAAPMPRDTPVTTTARSSPCRWGEASRSESPTAAQAGEGEEEEEEGEGASSKGSRAEGVRAAAAAAWSYAIFCAEGGGTEAGREGELEGDWRKEGEKEGEEGVKAVSPRDGGQRGLMRRELPRR